MTILPDSNTRGVSKRTWYVAAAAGLIVVALLAWWLTQRQLDSEPDLVGAATETPPSIVPVVWAGRTYDGDTIESGVRAALDEASRLDMSAEAAANRATEWDAIRPTTGAPPDSAVVLDDWSPPTNLADQTVLQQCLRALDISQPTVVDLATWREAESGNTQPAAIVVEAGSDTDPTAWVVGQGCGADGQDQLIGFYRVKIDDP